LSEPKINIKLNGYYLERTIYITITILMTFGLIVTTSNFLQSDPYSYWTTGGWHSPCGSSIGFIDFFTGEWNCSARNSIFGMATTFAPFFFSMVLTGLNYFFWFQYFNEKNHWIGITITQHSDEKVTKN